MLTSYMPKRLIIVRYAVVALLAILLLVYLIVAIIRAVRSPILLDMQFEPTKLVPPVVIIDGKRNLFEQATIFVQGLYLDASGRETATGNLDGAFALLKYGEEIETSLPDDFNDALNQDKISWWLKPNDTWRFAVNFTAATGDTRNLFTALRIGVKVPSTATNPSLDIRLLQPGSTKAYLTQSQLSPVGTSAVGRNREVRYTETRIVHLNDKTNTIYTAINLDYGLPNTTTPADFFITLRSGNTLDDSGNYLLPIQRERLAFTWYDVLSGVGGLAGLLTTAYYVLFGDSKLRTWGPVQWLMRKDIIKGTEELHAKEVTEKANLSMDERLAQLEQFKDRINHYYVEHSLFEDKYTNWF